MLGNEMALWDIMLAAIKLGVVLIPATTLLTPEDLKDRLERGQVRHVIAGAAHAWKFDTMAGNYSRISVGGSVSGWTAFEKAYQLEVLVRYAVTSLCAPPTVWRILIQENLAAYPG